MQIEAAVAEDRLLCPEAYDPDSANFNKWREWQVRRSAESRLLAERGVFHHPETGLETLDGLRRRVPAVDPELAELDLRHGVFRYAADGVRERATNWLEMRVAIEAGRPVPAPRGYERL